MTYAAYIAESRRIQAMRWTGAAVLVISLHAGGALALLHMREDDSVDVAGAIAIDLAPVTAAPDFTSDAPGPLMQEKAPAPETRKQTKETVAEETPPLEPAPLAPEPAVQLPEPQPDKKYEPEEKVDEKVAHEENFRQTAATAPPPSEVKPSDAARRGFSAIAAKAQANWQSSLVTHINRYKRYPAEARAHKVEGIVTIEFTLDRSGQILSSRVIHSSGSPILDEEAAALLRRAAPLPSPPQEVPPEGLQLALPIHFRMR